MPLADIKSPSDLHPIAMDLYLATGWFRMGQQFFTTQFLHFNDQFFSAFWLRIQLSKWAPSKSQAALIRRIEQRFTTTIGPYEYDPIDDQLFAKYRTSIAFEHSNSIHQLLFGTAEYQIFHTQAIRIWDQDQLIGLGFFDEGWKSIAGISCIFDPDYRKYSLGKYMMLRKMRWGQSQGKSLFYPGYCAPGYPVFDYKLTLAPEYTYYYKITTFKWRNWTPDLPLPIEVIQKKMHRLSEALSKAGIAHSILAYPYFDTNTASHLRRFNLLDQPLIIALHSTQTHQFPLVYFDYLEGNFQLRKAQKFFILNSTPETSTKVNTFSEALLKAHLILFVHKDPKVMAEFIRENIQFKIEQFQYKTKGYLDPSQ